MGEIERMNSKNLKFEIQTLKDKEHASNYSQTSTNSNGKMN